MNEKKWYKNKIEEYEKVLSEYKVQIDQLKKESELCHKKIKYYEKELEEYKNNIPLKEEIEIIDTTGTLKTRKNYILREGFSLEEGLKVLPNGAYLLLSESVYPRYLRIYDNLFLFDNGQKEVQFYVKGE